MSASLHALFRKRHAARARKLESALASAARALIAKTRKETLYAVALYTSGESELTYVRLSANTEEGLDRAVAKYGGKHDAKLRARLRWIAPDWAYHDFSKLGGMRFPLLVRGRAEDAVIYEIMLEALRKIDRKGTFGKGDDRAKVALAVMCGDMGSRFFLRGLRALNPPAVVKRVTKEWRAVSA